MPNANETGNLHLSSSSRNMQLIRIAPSMPSSCTEIEREREGENWEWEKWEAYNL